ncbi:MAG: hypothetical protein WCI73_14370 [Phycisphaerae bacterium]
MPFTDCPKCLARVRYPETPPGTNIRCTKCGQTFPAPAPPSAPTPAAIGAALPAASATAAPRVATSGVAHDEPFELKRPGRIFSAADEAMLRELGSGSGLLDLTSEALQTGEWQPHASGDDLAGGGGRDLSDRQFQIVGTALTMANKLTEVYKGELARARRLSLGIWSACALVLVGGLFAFGWGMVEFNAAKLEQTRSTSSAQSADQLKLQVGDLRAQVGDLKSQAAELKTQLGEVKGRYEEEKAHAGALGSELQAAKARNTELQNQVEAARAATTMPAGAAAGPAVARP